jgi:hypothetical protein
VVWLVEAWNAVANSKVAAAAPNVYDASIALGVLGPALLGAILLLMERPGPTTVIASSAGLEAQFDRRGSTVSMQFPWKAIRFAEIGLIPRVRAQSAFRRVNIRTERELFESLRRIARAG